MVQHTITKKTPTNLSKQKQVHNLTKAINEISSVLSLITAATHKNQGTKKWRVQANNIGEVSTSKESMRLKDHQGKGIEEISTARGKL